MQSLDNNRLTAKNRPEKDVKRRKKDVKRGNKHEISFYLFSI